MPIFDEWKSYNENENRFDRWNAHANGKRIHKKCEKFFLPLNNLPIWTMQNFKRTSHSFSAWILTFCNHIISLPLHHCWNAYQISFDMVSKEYFSKKNVSEQCNLVYVRTNNKNKISEHPAHPHTPSQYIVELAFMCIYVWVQNLTQNLVNFVDAANFLMQFK